MVRMAAGDTKYQVVVIGASSGGIVALQKLLALLPSRFSLPVLVVIHLHPHSENSSLVQVCFAGYPLPIKEVEDKEPISPGTVYFAPPNYHVLVEEDRTLSLNVDEKVNCSRPSIDVLFESAAEVYGAGVIGVILTGASQDGAAGLKKIMKAGGLVLIQDPAEAEADVMPRSALAACRPERVWPLVELAAALTTLAS